MRGVFSVCQAKQPPNESNYSNDWPDPPAPEAFYGVAGEIVKLIEPVSEADPAALLVQFLVMFGSAIGRSSYFIAEETRHYANLFSCFVGSTSKSRKGSSFNRVRHIFRSINEEDWGPRGTRIRHGLSSGEGLI
jgi:hypothetical protein